MLSSKHLGGITDNEQTYKVIYFVALSAKVKKKFKNFIKVYKYKRRQIIPVKKERSLFGYKQPIFYHPVDFMPELL